MIHTATNLVDDFISLRSLRLITADYISKGLTQHKKDLILYLTFNVELLYNEFPIMVSKA